MNKKHDMDFLFLNYKNNFWFLKLFCTRHLVLWGNAIKRNSDCKWTRTQNHLVLKRTLNHLPKLAKWLGCVPIIYLYSASDCMFLSCHVCFTVNPHSILTWQSHTVKCTIQTSNQGTTQSFGQFGWMVECSFIN